MIRSAKLVGIVLLALSLSAVGGCGSREAQQGGEERGPGLPKWEEYAHRDKIQQMLYELVAARDPQAAAERLGFDSYLMVRVVLVLADPEAELPEGFTIYVERRVEDEVQALVPVEQLLKLAEHPQIKYIRAPVKPRKL